MAEILPQTAKELEADGQQVSTYKLSKESGFPANSLFRDIDKLPKTAAVLAELLPESGEEVAV